MRSIPVLAFVALIAGVAPALANAQPPEQKVEIKGYHFVPDKLTVPIGTKITWANKDQVPHTVAEKTKKFRSAAMDTDDTYSFTFTEAGTYSYFCTLHPQMVGEIAVTAK